MTAPMNEFDLDRNIADSWSRFSARLAEVVSMMEPGATLTIGSIASEDEGHSPFVSFSCGDGHRITTEASSNAILGEDFQLTPDQLENLEQQGWRPPNADEPHSTQNYWFAADQEDAVAIADQAVGALRDVFAVPHPAFLAPDQLAEVLTPPTPREASLRAYRADDLVAISPTSADHLDTLVGAELVRSLGHQPLRDADGDFAIRVGSAMVFVRITTDAREVLVFSPLVHELEGRSRAMEVISDLNAEARFVKFLLIRDRVFASMSVLAHPFVPAHLHQALTTMSLVADQLDEQLATKLRGRTTFNDEDSV